MGIHDRLIGAVADELCVLARRVEAIGVAAASDAGFAARHLALLQEVDLITQTQSELAGVLKVLAVHGAEGATDGIRLEALARRLGEPAQAG